MSEMASLESKAEAKDKLTRVALIGTSGHKQEDAKRLTREMFAFKKEQEMQTLQKWKLSPTSVILVSGGSSWADHVAVSLWLDHNTPQVSPGGPAPGGLGGAKHPPFAGLRLYFPESGCPWISSRGANNPGRILHDLHLKFSATVGIDSIEELSATRTMPGVVWTTKQGFSNRNAEIATNSDRMIAFSFAPGNAPTRGGTLDTWRAFRGPYKKHISLIANSSSSSSSSSTSNSIQPTIASMFAPSKKRPREEAENKKESTEIDKQESNKRNKTS